MRRIQKLALSSTAVTTFLIAWGGLVRATGSGDGCPDWPKCFGRWVPPLEYHALIEYAHRSLVVAVTLLVGLQAWAALRRHRREPGVLWPSVAAIPLILVQSALGGAVVQSGLDPAWVTAHFAVAMLVLAALVLALTNTFEAARARHGPGLGGPSLWTAAAIYGLLLVGTYVRAENAGIVFPDWPLMDGRLVPALGGAATAMFLHRVLAAAVTLLVLWAAIRARNSTPRSRASVALTTALLALYAAQVLVGAANVWTKLDTWARTTHVALSALIWAAAVALVAVTRGTPEAAGAQQGSGGHERGERSLRETTLAYVRLTKPRIVVLLLVTTVPAMVLAERGLPSPWLVLATLAGGAVAAGAANAVNSYLDRDIDGIMRRTRRRPLPAHQISADGALRFGFVMGAASFFLLGVTVNVLAAALALSAIAFYVFVYTLWLKRTSVQNIVIGGAAGAVPALVGWAAVTGTVALPAWILFAIVFVWTPPHFWALAMQYRSDYAAAGVPMLPVVRGDDVARRQILLYSLLLFATTLVLYPVAHMGPVYLATAIALGGLFVFRALRLWREHTPALAMRLFRFSNVYLALLFAAVAVDVTLPLG